MNTFRGGVGVTAFTQKAGYIDFRLRKEVAIFWENVPVSLRSAHATKLQTLIF